MVTLAAVRNWEKVKVEKWIAMKFQESSPLIEQGFKLIPISQCSFKYLPKIFDYFKKHRKCTCEEELKKFDADFFVGFNLDELDSFQSNTHGLKDHSLQSLAEQEFKNRVWPMSVDEYFESKIKAEEEEYYIDRKACLKANLKALEELMSNNFAKDENVMQELQIKWEAEQKKLEEVISRINDENMMGVESDNKRTGDGTDDKVEEFYIKEKAHLKVKIDVLRELMSSNFYKDENSHLTQEFFNMLVAEEKKLKDLMPSKIVKDENMTVVESDKKRTGDGTDDEELKKKKIIEEKNVDA